MSTIQTDKFNPTEHQRRFFEEHILAEEGTILTLKVSGTDPRGFSVNIRGPFKLAVYHFKHSETVIDAIWAGDQESKSHMHCCWSEVRFAKLSRTSQEVRDNIGYQWQISFFASEHDTTKNDRRLFWFYLENDDHKAVQKLQEDIVTPVA